MTGSGGERDVLLVASQFGQTLDFFDPQTLEKLDTIEDLIAQPHEIAWDPGRRLAYMTHTYRAGAYNEGKPKAHELSVIDPDRREIVDTIDLLPYLAPHDVEFDPAADLIYTGVEAEDGRNGIVIVDPGSREIVGNIGLQARNAHWMAIAPDGAKAYVTHKEGEVVTVVDLHGRRQLATVACPGGAEEVDCSPSGRWAFVAAPMMNLVVNVAQGQLNKKPPRPGEPTPALLRIDTATEEVSGRLEFEDYLCAIRVAPDGRVLAMEMRFPDPETEATGPVRGRVHVVDPETMTLLASVEVDELPFTARCTPDSSRAFVANLKTGSVSVIDLGSYELLATLDNNIGPGFGGSHGMCFVPAAGGSA